MSDDNVVSIDKALKDVEELKNKTAFPGTEHKPLIEEEEWQSKAVFIIEVLDEAQKVVFQNSLWESYAYMPDAPALIGRAYKDSDHLMRTWAGDGVLLLLVESLQSIKTLEYKDEILAVGSLADRDRIGITAELRYMIGFVHAGRGIQKLAIRHFSKFANQRLGVERLYMMVFEDDTVTKEILTKKHGWDKCGTLPGYGYKNGEKVNVLILTAGLETLIKYSRDEDGGGKQEQQGKQNNGSAGEEQGL